MIMFERPRILVIDDDPLFRQIMVSMLRRDFDVSAAAEGSEGYFKALDTPPDAVLVDIHMQGWDGVKTIQALRGHPTVAGMKILVLTADPRQEGLVAALAAGADDYLLKTHLTREGLLLKLEHLLPHLVRPTFRTRTDSAVPASAPAVPQPNLASLPQSADGKTERPALQGILDSWE